MTKDVDMVMSKIKSAFVDDVMPQFNFDQVGRIRLVNALSRKYGSQFRNDAKAKEAIEAFDSELDFATQLRGLKGRKNG